MRLLSEKHALVTGREEMWLFLADYTVRFPGNFLFMLRETIGSLSVFGNILTLSKLQLVWKNNKKFNNKKKEFGD